MEGEGGQGSGGEGFFFIFKHSWAPKGSWKISYGGPGKSRKSPGFFVSKRVGTLIIIIVIVIIVIRIIIIIIIIRIIRIRIIVVADAGRSPLKKRYRRRCFGASKERPTPA